MVAWFITAITTVGLFAYIAFVGVSTTSDVQDLGSRTEVVRRLDAAADALVQRASSPFGDGTIYLPAGREENGLYRLPAEMEVMGSTPMGTLIQYCPMGGVLGTSNDVVRSQGSSYQIRTETINDKTYVVGGRIGTGSSADPNIIGFLMAPATRANPVSSCASILASGDGFVAPNSIVRAIRRSTAADRVINDAASTLVYYVSPEGRGKGIVPSDPASLATALAGYRTNVSSGTTIYLSDGSYSASGNLLDQAFNPMPLKKAVSTLSIIATGQGGANFDVGTINVPSDISLTRLMMPSRALLTVDAGRHADVVNSTMGSVRALNGSSIDVNGTTSFTASQLDEETILVDANSSIRFGNQSGTRTTITGYHKAGGNFARIASGGTMVLFNTDMNIQGSDGNSGNTGFFVEKGAVLDLRTSNITFNTYIGYAIGTAGRTVSMGSNLYVNKGGVIGLQVDQGGEALWYGDVRGAMPPSYGVAAQRTKLFKGVGNISGSVECWFRGARVALHELSAPGVNGAIDAVTADEPLPTLDAVPTRQQIQDYNAAMSRNARRADNRVRLNPGGDGYFTCRR